MAAYLEPVRPFLAPSLIAPEALAAVAETAALLPSQLGHNAFGFELRLDDDSRSADFLLAVNPPAGDLATLAQAKLPRALRAEHAWAALDRLAARCAGPEAPLRRQIANLWLEFDIAGPAPQLPSLFFMPIAQLRPGRQDHRAAFAIAEEVLRLVARETPDCLESGLLARAFELLPPAASLFQIGVMNARPNRLVRVCAALHNRRTLLAYLAAIGYPGDRTEVHRFVEWLRRYSDRLRLNLDFGSEVHPKLGFEAYLHGPRAPEGWESFLAALGRLGACRAEKADALLSYIGTSRPADDPESWPRHLREAAGWLAGQAKLSLQRTLHHVKLVLEPGRPLVAKAYLGAEVRWS
jgi:hypothetical protein